MEVSIDTLNPQQLAGLKKQLEEELEHLSNSFTQLAAIQSKFRDCLSCVKTFSSSSSMPTPPAAGSVEGESGVGILVPLTTSLYVRGTLESSDKVLVDLGTGFLVEKDLSSATEFYTGKIQDITANVQNIETMVEKKSGNLRLVEEVLRQKLVDAPPA